MTDTPWKQICGSIGRAPASADPASTDSSSIQHSNRLYGDADQMAMRGAIALTAIALLGVSAESAMSASLALSSGASDLEHQSVLSTDLDTDLDAALLDEAESPLLLSQQFSTEFPLPSSVRNFQNIQGPGEAAINFQTDLNMNQAIAFYRQQFSQLGLTERTVNTAITDSTFNLIFDTWANGKPVVVQGVSMGRSLNINLRLDDDL